MFDELTIVESERDSFSCNIDLPERNTVTKALSLVKEFVDVPPLAITLKKEIPTGAGLGGGSSDAAGLLKHINEFAKFPLQERELQDIAFAVGADVPFFLLCGRAKGEGYGEKLTSLPDMPKRWLVIAKPDIECSTAEMYKKLDENTSTLQPFNTSTLYNAFEAVAPEACIRLIEHLRESGATPSLTGSGSAVFGYCESESQAHTIAESLSRTLAPWIRIAHTISPL